jgi:hypothetical protein
LPGVNEDEVVNGLVRNSTGMESLDQLLKAAEKAGSFDSTGQFTVAVEIYKNRLGQDFSTAYPGQYPLKFVQSMVAFGARSIAISSGLQTLSIECIIPTKRSMSQYLNLALEHQNSIPKGDPTTPFLQGLWAALAEEHSAKVLIEQAGKAETWVCKPSSIRRESSECPDAQQDHAKLIISFQRTPALRKSERKLICSRCGYCPIQLELNGKRIDGTSWEQERRQVKADWYLPYAPEGFRLAEAYFPNKVGKVRSSLGLPPPNRRNSCKGANWEPTSRNVFFVRDLLCDKGFSGVLAIPVDLEPPGVLLPVLYGVTLEPIQAEEFVGGGVAVVECLHWNLQTDLFGLRLVENPHLAELRTRLGIEFHGLGRELVTSIGRLKSMVKTNRLAYLSLTAGVIMMGGAFFSGMVIHGLAGGVQLLNGAIMKDSTPQFKRNKEFSSLAKRKLRAATFYSQRRRLDATEK